MWSRHLEWPTDLRWGGQVELLIERLKELGLARARVGVAGSAGVHHRPDGIIPYASWIKIEAALPASSGSLKPKRQTVMSSKAMGMPGRDEGTEGRRDEGKR